MTAEQKTFVRELRDINRDLAEWAELLFFQGMSVDYVRERLQQAAKLTGRD